MPKLIQVSKIKIYHHKGEIVVDIIDCGEGRMTDKTVSFDRCRKNIERDWDQFTPEYYRPRWNEMNWYCETKDLEDRKQKALELFVKRVQNHVIKLMEDLNEANAALKLAQDLL